MKTSSQDKIEAYRAKGWWDDRTLHALFDQVAAEVPSRLALVDASNRSDIAFGPPRRLDYASVDSEARRIAEALFVAGVKQGDCVLVQLPNIVELVLLYIAASRLGAIISPVPMQYGRHELAMIAGVVQPKAFVSLTQFKGDNVAAAHRPALAEEVVALAFGPDVTGDIRAIDTLASDGALAREAAAYIDGIRHSGNDILTVCWTSGTTGRPKGVPRSHNHWFNQSYSVEDAVKPQDGDVLLNPFPFVNMAAISGFLFVWLFARGTLVLHHPFDLALMLKQMVVENVTYTIAPPAVLNMLIGQKDLLAAHDLSKLRTICSGSAPLSPWMVKGFKDVLGVDIINTFGSNEGIALVSSGADVPDPEHRALYFPRFGVAGLTWSNRIAERTETKLVDPVTGEVVDAPGRPGELCIRGPNVFDGYLNSPEDNAAAFDHEGFFRTGDMLEIVDAGDPPRFYRFVGRCKDIINRGGMKISPEELDNILVSHPKIKEAATFSEPDKILGERVCLAAVAKPGQDLVLADITGLLKEKDVAIFKWPERLVLVESLPRNPLGKVVRGELKRLYAGSPS
ncbi:MAG: acyl--CoA ligase [Alphaproteobacteria bacterium]|nr:acyl--CoA ligase [Alphaproteobacteria bacterium]